jgi:hypothetical protein
MLRLVPRKGTRSAQVLLQCSLHGILNCGSEEGLARPFASMVQSPTAKGVTNPTRRVAFRPELQLRRNEGADEAERLERYYFYRMNDL